MPYGSVTLIPGVNVERTPTLNQAGIARSALVRFKDSLIQKLGGWARFYPNAVAGAPRDLHAWEDLNGTTHLAVASTTQLGVITSGVLQAVTPQTVTSDFTPSFTTNAGSPLVEITDPNISNVTTYDSVFFNTPIAVDGLILQGIYPIGVITGTHSYKITASANATSGVTAQGATPVFTTAINSAIVSVALAKHGLTTGQTHAIVFQIPTTGNGVTISGSYSVTVVTDVNNFTITVTNQASANGDVAMNTGLAELVYYINLGPPPVGAGFGLGTFGSGGFGTGSSSSSQTGTAITASDWTSDNWGQILLACPSGGGIYQFDPTGGFTTAGLVGGSAPIFNGGIFVSTSLQILFAWASTDSTATIGLQQDPMLIRWSDLSNFTQFTALSTNQAGSFRIPIGSTLRAGMAVANQNLFWTDLDLWAANYAGFPLVFGFNKIGAGAGAISSHAVQQLRGGVYWMGASNFYAYTGSGVAVIPCPVWDAVFQNLSAANVAKVRAMPNTPFNEVGWLYPSAASTGECDSYVKFNITEPGGPWDFGPAAALPRSAWMDQSILGTPIAASPAGVIYQQESTNDADGQPLNASFTTGYFYIAEGEEFAFIDQIIPDFIWGTYAGSATAQIQMSFNLINYPGDTPVVFGPYTVTRSTQFLPVRMRGRQMSITVASSDVGSFWRLGKVRYRWAASGRNG